MATFTSGQTLTLSLDYDDYISWQGQGVATITPTTGSVSTTYLTGSQTLGPYKQYVTISIVTSSSGSYTQNSQPAVDTPAVYATDSQGNVTGLVGPSGITYGIQSTYTWAQLQALTGVIAGTRAYVTDPLYGFVGEEFVYTGTIWTKRGVIQLLGSGIPFVFQTSCTIGAATNSSSAITGLTSLGAVVNYPYPCYTYWTGANATSAGLTSGTWYYTVLTAATTATLYNNTYTGGTPVIPASPANFTSLAGGAYTQTVAAAVTGPSVQVPPSLLGLNGGLRMSATQLCTGAVTSYMGYGATSNVMASGYLTVAEIGMSLREVRNRGSASSQIVRNSGAGNTWDTNGNTSNTYLSINSALVQTAGFAMQPGAATTWQLIESYSIEALLGA